MMLSLLGQTITPDAVLLELKVSNLQQGYQDIAREAARHTGLQASVILAALLDSERQEKAGIGDGVAIPHLRLPMLQRPFRLLARLPHKIKFEGPDDMPVDLVYLLLSPENDGPLHLRRLSRITRLLKDRAFCDGLRGASSTDAIYALMMDPDGRMLAA